MDFPAINLMATAAIDAKSATMKSVLTRKCKNRWSAHSPSFLMFCKKEKLGNWTVLILGVWKCNLSNWAQHPRVPWGWCKLPPSAQCCSKCAIRHAHTSPGYAGSMRALVQTQLPSIWEQVICQVWPVWGVFRVGGQKRVKEGWPHGQGSWKGRSQDLVLTPIPWGVCNTSGPTQET